MALLLPSGTAEPPKAPPVPVPVPAPPDPPPAPPAAHGSPEPEEWGWGGVIAGLGANGNDTSPYHISGSSRHEEEPALLAQPVQEEEWFWSEPAAAAAATESNGGDWGWRPVVGDVPDGGADDVWPPAAAPAPSPRADTRNVLTDEEKISLLTLEYPSFSLEELKAALEGSNGRLEDATRLLASFLAEDSAASQRERAGQPSTVDMMRLVEEIEAKEQAAAAPAPADATTLQLDALAAKFPDMARDGLMVALELASFDLEAAERVLREQTAAEEAPPPLPSSALADAAPLPVPRMSQHARNQEIYDQERAQVDRLRTAYQQLFSQARHAADRGEAHLVDALNVRGDELREEYFKASQRAAQRIALRVNRGKRGFMTVDLHGLHVDEAVGRVAQALDSLPSISPGGVVVRYITGRGAHSEAGAAKVKPAVIALLEERGVHFSADVGYVDVIIEGTAV